jgi:hypothetical protein
MAQNTVSAASVNTATSSDITVAAGAKVTVGIFAASGSLHERSFARVYQDTPGGDNKIGELTNSSPTFVLDKPGTFRVIKDGAGSSYGVFTET